jgi:hypothetical protein
MADSAYSLPRLAAVAGTREAGLADARFATVRLTSRDLTLQAGDEELLVAPGLGPGSLAQPLHGVGGVGAGQPGDPAGGGGEQHPVTSLAGADAEPDRQVGLAGACRSGAAPWPPEPSRLEEKPDADRRLRLAPGAATSTLYVSRSMVCVSSSCGPAVLVDQAAKPISALDPAGRHGDHVHRLVGPALREALVRPSPVIVLDELGQHRLQVPPTEDQQVVECLAPCCPHPSFGE